VIIELYCLYGARDPVSYPGNSTIYGPACTVQGGWARDYKIWVPTRVERFVLSARLFPSRPNTKEGKESGYARLRLKLQIGKLMDCKMLTVKRLLAGVILLGILVFRGEFLARW